MGRVVSGAKGTTTTIVCARSASGHHVTSIVHIQSEEVD